MTGQRSKLFAASLRGFLGAIVLLQLKQAAALSALSDWYNGTATYYGGPADNMDPYSPSYGTKEVFCSSTAWQSAPGRCLFKSSQEL